MEVPFSIPQCNARCGVVRPGRAELARPHQHQTRNCGECGHWPAAATWPPASRVLTSQHGVTLSSAPEVRWRQGPVLARYFRYLTLQSRSRRHLA